MKQLVSERKEVQQRGYYSVKDQRLQLNNVEERDRYYNYYDPKAIGWEPWIPWMKMVNTDTFDYIKKNGKEIILLDSHREYQKV